MPKVNFYISDLGEGGAQIVTLQHAKILKDIGYCVEIIILSDKQVTLDINVPYKIISNKLPKIFRIMKQAFEVKNINRDKGSVNICVMEYAGLICWLAGIQFMQVFHSDIHYKYEGVKKIILNWVLTSKKIKSIFVSNELIKNNMKNGLKPKTEILENFYEPRVFSSYYESDEKYIIYIGRLVSVKDPLELVQVYFESNLSENYKLIIVGDGGLRNVIETYIHEKNIEDRVYITGWVDNANYFLKNASLMIASSHSEAAPNTIIDAFFMSVPVFVTKNNSGYTSLIGGERGYVCESTSLRGKGIELNNYMHNNSIRSKHIINALNYIKNRKLIDKYKYIEDLFVRRK